MTHCSEAVHGWRKISPDRARRRRQFCQNVSSSYRSTAGWRSYALVRPLDEALRAAVVAGEG
jgi:hypothetical protein